MGAQLKRRRGVVPVARGPLHRVGTAVAWVIALLVLLGAVGWFSPLFSVRSVTVRGERTITEQQVLNALAVPDGTRLAGLDLAAAAARVQTLPRVAGAQVEAMLPSSITITVTERVAVAWTGEGDGTHLLDATGTDFAREAPPVGLPQLTVATPGATDPATVAALRVLASLPADVRALVSRVSASSPASVQLELTDGRTVGWGDPDDAARKSSVLMVLLTRPGHHYDVSSPDLPTVR